MTVNEVRLSDGREKSLLRRHPWVYSGAIAQVIGAPEVGSTVKLYSADGRFLCLAAYNANSQIAARAWSWDEADEITPDFFRGKLLAAIGQRATLLPDVHALRLVHGESDGLPGFILDRYGDVLVAQFLAAGAEYWKSTLSDLALELTGCRFLYERSDVEARRLEGFELSVGPLRGGEPPEHIEFLENGCKFLVDVRLGHKTGFYLDQRANRKRIAELSEKKDVLDCFCYSGGFTVSALAGGAHSVLAVDSSKDALELARRHVELNGFDAARVEWQEEDVFHLLRGMRDRRRTFDLIVLDPPKFAQTAAQVERAARGYKDINLLAFKLLRPGGILVTFSCSGGVSIDLFQKIVAGAALDAQVDAQIIERLGQGIDHPVALNFPEGAYLKGLVIRRSDA